jgi:hypothetical protein
MRKRDTMAHTCRAKGFARLQSFDHSATVQTICVKRQLPDIMEQALLA